MPTALVASLLGHVVLILLLTLGLPALFEPEKKISMSAAGVGVVTEAQLEALTKPPLPPGREAREVAAADAPAPKAAEAARRAADAAKPRPAEAADKPAAREAAAREAAAAARTEPAPAPPRRAAAEAEAPPPKAAAPKEAPPAPVKPPATAKPEPPKPQTPPPKPPQLAEARPPATAAAPAPPTPDAPTPKEPPRPKEALAQAPTPQSQRARSGSPLPPRRPDSLRKPEEPPPENRQVAEAPAQEKPSPEKPAAKPKDSFADLMANAIGKPSSNDGMAGVAEALGVGVAGGSLSSTDRDALAARLGGCWRPLRGAARPETLVVELSIELEPTSEVRDIEVVRRPGPDAGAFGARAVERAVAAVRQCSPFNQPGALVLPAGDYQQWRRMRITFDPRNMAG